MERTWESVYGRLRQITDIPDEEWLIFKERCVPGRVEKNSHFIREGERADSIGICVGGLFRIYYTTPEGTEYIKSFCPEGDFIAPYGSLLQDAPSYLSIQALTDSEIVRIRFDDFRSLYARHVCWERFGRLLAEQLFVKKETRERELLMLSAEERYRSFLREYEGVARIVPQYHIASYLGITPVALSRIRAKINLG